MFYSPTTEAFYDPEADTGSMPSDAIEVSADEHDDLVAALAEGKIIVIDDAGRPVAADKPVPPGVSMFYSPTTRGFYDLALHGDAIPTDAVEISAEEHRALIAAQAAGKTIVIGDEGRPVAADTPVPPAAEQRAEALARIDREHARYLARLTGGATQEERDTWAPKETAARAVLDGTARPAQATMLAEEAAAKDTTSEELAARIVAKSDSFHELVGRASAMRARAEAAILQATAPDVPDDQVAARVAAAFETLAQEVAEAISQFQQSSVNQGGSSN